MSNWYRFHMGEALKAMVIPDSRRFFIHIREPEGESRHPVEFYRWKLKDAQEAADRVVQAYYPHECEGQACDVWRKSDD